MNYTADILLSQSALIVEGIGVPFFGRQVIYYTLPPMPLCGF